jgi:aryl-alcohol dehydrogenase-like predicted oxidoreductase
MRMPASVVLLGAATAEQLRSNLEATTVELSEDDVARLTTMAEDPLDYWTARSALPWT